jgi:hypothetical protein
MASCRSCQATIVWAVWSDTNRPVPIDPRSTNRGNVIKLATTDPQGRPIVRSLTRDERVTYRGPRWTTHYFATCPNADQHRHTR